jgi:hypothetical protein
VTGDGGGRCGMSLSEGHPGLPPHPLYASNLRHQHYATTGHMFQRVMPNGDPPTNPPTNHINPYYHSCHTSPNLAIPHTLTQIAQNPWQPSLGGRPPPPAATPCPPIDTRVPHMARLIYELMKQLGHKTTTLM